MRKGGIKRKILFLVLGMSLISLTAFCAITTRGVFNIRSLVKQSSAQLGEFAIKNSSLFLEQEASEKLMAKAKSRAMILDERLLSIEKDATYFAHYATEIYKKAGKLPPAPVPYSSSENTGKLTLQLRSVNGKADYPRIKKEVELLGNIATAYKSNRDDMDVMTVAIFIGTESGFMISYSPFSNDRHQILDPRGRPWYVGAKESNDNFWTAPYIDMVSGKLVITCAHPVEGVNGEFAGVTGIDVIIDDLNNEIVNIDVGKHGYAFIVDSERTLISAGGFEAHERKIYERLKEHWDSAQEYTDLITRMASGKEGFERIPAPAGERFIAYSPIPATGWSLAIVQPVSEIMGLVTENSMAIEKMTDETLSAIHNMIRNILVNFLIVIAFAVLVITYIADRMANKFIKPIITLEECFERIANGELDTRVELKTGDEIERLGVSVNAMARELKEYIGNLQTVTAEKERIGAELDVARKIQASMLPCVFPPFPHRSEFDIYASMLPAKEVGGDFYDFFFIDENTLAVVMADVSGKGVPAALFMVIAKTLIKNTALSGKSPEVVFGIVNNMLCENNDAGMFVTAFMGYLDIETGKFTYVNAGHTPPVLRLNGRFELLKMKPGFVLAGLESTRFKQDEITLQKGDELFLYTDGVTEAMNNEKTLFGEVRLIKAMNNYGSLPVKEFIVSIKLVIDDFAEGVEQADDITVLALRYRGLEEKINNNMEELTIEAKTENLDAVLEFVAKKLETAECLAKLQTQINIAVEEVFVNIAYYAYSPDVGGVSIRVSVGDGGVVTIEFEDGGKPYNPLKKEDPNITAGVEEREVGGLGIFMVKKLMDFVDYKREGNKNILTLKKKL
jgi:sigma-B regulation protein RsbU (phosphoserine phosphatase)